MDIYDAIASRRSIRAYQETPVPKGKIVKILNSARLAPSARNLQPWHFIAVTDSQKRRDLSKGIFAKFLVQAPVVIVACGNKEASAKWYRIDVAIALENMVLAAAGEGLGTCLIGSFDQDNVKAVVKLPDDFRVVALLAVGYAKEKVDLTRKLMQLVRRRKLLSEIASEEEFGQQFTEE